MKRFILIAVLFCVVAFPAQATPAERALSDSTLRQAVTAVFEEARLTARLEFDTYRWVQEVPLIEGATYQDQVIDGRLQPVTLYVGGFETGIEFRDVRLFGWFRFNLGDGNIDLLTSGKTGARFRDGEIIGTLADVRLSNGGMRLDYTPKVLENFALGGGGAYHKRAEGVGPIYLDRSSIVANRLYQSKSNTELLFLYASARYHFGWGTLRARVGGSLWGSHSTLYEPSLAYDDPTPGPGEPPPAPGNLTKQEWEFKEVDPRAWFAEVGVDVLIHSFMIRPSLRVNRLQLEGAYTETVGGLKLQVGLPF